MPKYSSAICHGLLAGTGIYCCTRYHKWGGMDLPCATFTIVVASNVIGAFRFGLPDEHGDKLDDIYKVMYKIEEVLALSCIAGQMCIQYGMDNIFGYAHPGVSCIPLVGYATSDGPRDDAIDTVVGLNAISCGVFAALKENWYGVAAAVSFAVAEFGKFADSDMEWLDIHNCVLCVFTYCAFRAVGALPDEKGEKLESTFRVTSKIEELLALSFLSGQMCIQAGMDNIFGYLHPIISTLPMIGYATDEGVRKDYSEIVVGLNAISCVVFSFLEDNWCGIIAAVSFGIAEFGSHQSDDQDVPWDEIRSCILCIFTYFALEAVDVD